MNMKWFDLKKWHIQALKTGNLKVCANLCNADLHGADLDFSCWPLWCGTSKVTVDEKIAKQLLAHAFAIVQPFMQPTEEQVKFCNEFHRIQSGEFPPIKLK